MLTVRVCNRQRLLKGMAPRIRSLCRLAAPKDWDGAELGVALVSGEEMADLNSRYTGRSRDTDVLAFPLADDDDSVLGEIVISASCVLAEANARGIDPADELGLYVVHGMLHLQGYDDHSTADRRKMYAREREVLIAAGLGDVRRQRRIRVKNRT